MDDKDKTIEAHYSRGNLGTAILEALRNAGRDLNALKIEDFAPIDAFHIRGLEATRELMDLGRLSPGTTVLDVGSGLGGSARFMAAEYGCHVTGVDLTEEFCDVAAMLSDRVGLGDKVVFMHGSALDMPFEAGRFDRVWTEHAQMNIADKETLYAEIYRVLKPGGLFLFHDVLAGDGGNVYYPAPWAHDATTSALISPDTLRTLLEDLGFRMMHWEDCTDQSTAWFQARVHNMKRQGPPPLGSHLIHGSQAKIRFENQVRNLEEHRIAVIKAALEKPA